MDLVGKKAPEFTLEDQDGNKHSLKDYVGQYVLLYFYPKDMTPGCTIEARNFRDSQQELLDLGVKVFGVSADSVARHKKFCESEDLNFTLLADVDKKTIEAYGVLKEKSMYGKKYMGISRESFLIGKDGMVLKHYETVKPAEHAAEVIEDVKGL